MEYSCVASRRRERSRVRHRLRSQYTVFFGWTMGTGLNLTVSDLKDKIEAETKAAEANQQV